MADYKIDLRFDEAAAVINDALADGIQDALEHVLAVSQPLVPVDTGELKASGGVDVDRDELRGEVYYGSDYPTKTYAAIQHEALDYHHPNGQPKFLEDPVNSERDNIGDIIADRVRKAAG